MWFTVKKWKGKVHAMSLPSGMRKASFVGKLYALGFDMRHPE
jgi:hypothetical protein